MYIFYCSGHWVIGYNLEQCAVFAKIATRDSTGLPSNALWKEKHTDRYLGRRIRISYQRVIAARSITVRTPDVPGGFSGTYCRAGRGTDGSPIYMKSGFWQNYYIYNDPCDPNHWKFTEGFHECAIYTAHFFSPQSSGLPLGRHQYEWYDDGYGVNHHTTPRTITISAAARGLMLLTNASDGAASLPTAPIDSQEFTELAVDNSDGEAPPPTEQIHGKVNTPTSSLTLGASLALMLGASLSLLLGVLCRKSRPTEVVAPFCVEMQKGSWSCKKTPSENQDPLRVN